VARWLAPLFLVSGATSLTYQLIWARQLYWIVGTSQLAISIVLAGFMLGLALGSFAAARFAGRVRRPLVGFAVLEAFIAIYALAFPQLLQPAAKLHLLLSSSSAPYSLSSVLTQFIVTGALLLPPTICMGATLPLLARIAASPDGRDAGSKVGLLYGVNTLGAVLGTALAGFVLLPRLGLASTNQTAVAGNLAVAASAALLALAYRPTTRAVAATATRSATARTRDDSKPILIIAALAGFASLLCEVAWFRLMTLILGGSTYSFSIMLLAFLLGIGIGGWAGGRPADRALVSGGRTGVLRRIGYLQLGVALLCWGAMFAYGALPQLFVDLFRFTGGTRTPLLAGELSLALAVMLPPALLMGATFPHLVRAAASDSGDLERPVGLIYGANTAGAIAGAATAGLFLLPALRMQGCIIAAASINLVAGTIAFAISQREPGRRLGLARLSVAALAGIAIIHVLQPTWNPLLMSSGVYRHAPKLTRSDSPSLKDLAVNPYKLLFYEEGPSSIITVAEARDDGNIWLATNGKVDASSIGDMPTQVLLAHIPAMYRRDTDRALVVGLGSGVTAGSLLLDREFGELDIVEIEPAIVRASHFFDEINNRPLDDARTHLHLNDARSHLLRTPDAYYDLVISEPSNPWISGVSNLFTREFFELGKSKLAPGGIWAQWLHLYGMQSEDLKSLLGAFGSTYEAVSVFRVGDTSLVILGSDALDGLHVLDIDKYVGKNQDIVDDLNRVEIKRAEDIIGRFQFGRSVMVELVGGVEHNTDDNMRIEYAAPLFLHADTARDNLVMLEEVAEVPLASVTSGRLAMLAFVYAELDGGWDRALVTLRHARDRRPDDPQIAALYDDYVALASKGRE
jgi:spermidine synthase